MPLDRDHDDFMNPEPEPEFEKETLLQAHWGKLLIGGLVIAGAIAYPLFSEVFGMKSIYTNRHVDSQIRGCPKQAAVEFFKREPDEVIEKTDASPHTVWRYQMENNAFKVLDVERGDKLVSTVDCHIDKKDIIYVVTYTHEDDAADGKSE